MRRACTSPTRAGLKLDYMRGRTATASTTRRDRRGEIQPTSTSDGTLTRSTGSLKACTRRYHRRSDLESSLPHSSACPRVGHEHVRRLAQRKSFDTAAGGARLTARGRRSRSRWCAPPILETFLVACSGSNARSTRTRNARAQLGEHVLDAIDGSSAIRPRIRPALIPIETARRDARAEPLAVDWRWRVGEVREIHDADHGRMCARSWGLVPGAPCT